MGGEEWCAGGSGGTVSGGFVLRILSGGVVWRALAGFGARRCRVGRRRRRRGRREKGGGVSDWHVASFCTNAEVEHCGTFWKIGAGCVGAGWGKGAWSYSNLWHFVAGADGGRVRTRAWWGWWWARRPPGVGWGGTGVGAHGWWTGPPGAVRERVVAHDARRPARRLVLGILTDCERDCKGILVILQATAGALRRAVSEIAIDRGEDGRTLGFGVLPRGPGSRAHLRGRGLGPNLAEPTHSYSGPAPAPYPQGTAAACIGS
jgi:hypothetical protein